MEVDRPVLLHVSPGRVGVQDAYFVVNIFRANGGWMYKVTQTFGEHISLTHTRQGEAGGREGLLTPVGFSIR